MFEGWLMLRSNTLEDFLLVVWGLSNREYNLQVFLLQLIAKGIDIIDSKSIIKT